MKLCQKILARFRRAAHALNWRWRAHGFTVLAQHNKTHRRFIACAIVCFSVCAVAADEASKGREDRQSAETWLTLESDRADYQKANPVAPGQASRLQSLDLQQQGLRDRQQFRKQQDLSLSDRQKSRVGASSPIVAPTPSTLGAQRAGRALQLQNQIQRQSWPIK